MNHTRKGNYLQTHAGINFYPLDPRKEEVYILDIAHALSLQCRFNGFCNEFYSIAQHSILCAEYLKQKYNDSALAFAGLLHDAAEAYCCDIPKPLKPFLTGYEEIEMRVHEVIMEKYVIDYTLTDYKFWTKIKEADNVMLATESRDLMSCNAYERWGKNLAAALPDPIVPQSWQDAEKSFMETFERLLSCQ